MLKWSFAGQLVKMTCFPPAWLLCCSWWDSNAYQIHSNNLFQLKGCPSLVGHSDGLCSYIYQRVGHLFERFTFASLGVSHPAGHHLTAPCVSSPATSLCLISIWWRLWGWTPSRINRGHQNTVSAGTGLGPRTTWVSPQACSKNSSTHWAVSKIQTDPTLLSHR